MKTVHNNPGSIIKIEGTTTCQKIKILASNIFFKKIFLQKFFLVQLNIYLQECYIKASYKRVRQMVHKPLANGLRTK